MSKQIHSIAALKPHRNQLRKTMTSAEVALWNLLKGEQLQGRKFRRQHSIETFVVDFYCASEKLIIELDGQGHYTPEGKLADRQRDEHLAALGFTVLRFENNMVFDQLNVVKESIVAAFR